MLLSEGVDSSCFEQTKHVDCQTSLILPGGIPNSMVDQFWLLFVEF